MYSWRKKTKTWEEYCTYRYRLSVGREGEYYMYLPRGLEWVEGVGKCWEILEPVNEERCILKRDEGSELHSPMFKNLYVHIQ